MKTIGVHKQGLARMEAVSFLSASLAEERYKRTAGKAP